MSCYKLLGYICNKIAAQDFFFKKKSNTMLTQRIPRLTKLNAHTVLNKFWERNTEMGEAFNWHISVTIVSKLKKIKYTDVPC